jgi:hypothetical protein
MRRTVLVLAAALTAACGGTAGTAGTPSPSASTTAAGPTLPPVPGMAAEAVRLRTDEAAGRRFQVRITDTGD